MTIKGAGADLVTIKPPPRTPRSLEDEQDIRNGVGDIVSVVGDTALPLTVDISGVTIDGNGASSRPASSSSTPRARLPQPDHEGRRPPSSPPTPDKPGAYRGPQFGYGIAQVTANTGAPANTARAHLTVTSRGSSSTTAGVLIDGATNDTRRYTRSGVINRGVISNNSIVGRAAVHQLRGNGNCTAPARPATT